MSKRWLINYLLFTLVIIFTWIGMKQPGVNKAEPILLTPLKAEEISRMQLQEGNKRLLLQKQGEHWWLPSQWPADTTRVNRMLSLAWTEASSSLEMSGIDLSTLGLDPIRKSVTLNDTRINFGDTNRIGSRRAVLSEAMVYLIPDNHLGLLSTAPGDWVSKVLLPEGVTPKALDLDDFQLQQNPLGAWQSSNAPQDHDGANRLVQNWQQLKATKISDYEADRTPLRKIVAELSTGRQIEWHLLSIKDDIQIARPDLKLKYHFPVNHYYSLLSIEPAPTEE